MSAGKWGMWAEFDLAAPDVRRDWILKIFAEAFIRPRSMSAIAGRGRLADLKRVWDGLTAVERRRWFSEFLAAVPELGDIGQTFLKQTRPTNDRD